VESALDAARGAPHRGTVGDVGNGAVDVEALQRGRPRGLADCHAHVVAAREQRPYDVRADEAGRAGDQHSSHGARIGCPPCRRSR
jgi:hypothetical protein